MAKKESTAFAVAVIDEDGPTRLIAVVNGEGEAASRLAFSIARETVHTDGEVACGVYELREDGSVFRRVATAGLARITGLGRSGDLGVLAALAVV